MQFNNLFKTLTFSLLNTVIAEFTIFKKFLLKKKTLSKKKKKEKPKKLIAFDFKLIYKFI